MKAMVFSDLIMVKRGMAQLFAVTAVVVIVISVGMETLVVIPAIAAAMIPMMLLFSVAAYDEMNGWEAFRLGLPLSRSSVVRGRYASLLLVTVAATVFGIVYALLVALLAAVFADGMGQNTLLASLLLESNPPEIIAASGCMGAAAMLLMATVTLPLVMRFGMTRATRFVPLVVLFAVVGLVALLGEGGPLASVVPQGMQWLMTSDDGFVTLVAGSLGVTLVLYAISAFISVRLYAAREF